MLAHYELYLQRYKNNNNVAAMLSSDLFLTKYLDFKHVQHFATLSQPWMAEIS